MCQPRELVWGCWVAVAALGLAPAAGCDTFTTPIAASEAGTGSAGDGGDAGDAACEAEAPDCVGRCGQVADRCGRARDCARLGGVLCAAAELCGAVSPNRCGCGDGGTFDVVISRLSHRDSPGSVSHCYAVGNVPKDGTTVDCAAFTSDGALLSLSSRKLSDDFIPIYRCVVRGAAGLTTYGLSTFFGAGCSAVGFAAPETHLPCGAKLVYERKHRFHESQLLSFDRFEGDANNDYSASPATARWAAWPP